MLARTSPWPLKLLQVVAATLPPQNPQGLPLEGDKLLCVVGVIITGLLLPSLRSQFTETRHAMALYQRSVLLLAAAVPAAAQLPAGRHVLLMQCVCVHCLWSVAAAARDTSTRVEMRRLVGGASTALALLVAVGVQYYSGGGDIVDVSFVACLYAGEVLGALVGVAMELIGALAAALEDSFV